MSAFTPGMRLGDRYQLQERIGAGGMAEVWRAHDSVLGRVVAIKALDGRLAADAALRDNARQEARAAARLNHPNITAIHDFAEQPLPDGRVVPYLVLELLTGETLAQRLSRGALPWAQASQFLAQIGAALTAAHALSVVHQDIKPSNIMLTPTGAKVLDFGIAAIRGRDSNPGWTSGTPAYAAPERLRAAPPHPSSDIYSLGVVAYEMATGKLPWEISTWEDVNDVHTRRQDSPAPQGIPAAAASVIQAALSADPAGRPAAAAFTQGNTDTMPVPPVSRDAATPAPTLIHRPDKPIKAAARVPDPPTRMAPGPSPMRPRKRRSPGVAAAGALIALMLILGAVFLGAAYLQSDKDVSTLPATSGPPAPTASKAAPSPSTVDNIPGLLVTLRQTVDAAALTGAIEDRQARELRTRLQDLSNRWKPGKAKDFIAKAEQLRDDIKDWSDEGEIADSVADVLDLLLDQLIKKAKAN